ncbi:MAG: hypothetical protein IEMM0002_0645 [bacterium]|nr:MAG: hypothetical protein IEMM0002_0645 [bacterium]
MITKTNKQLLTALLKRKKELLSSDASLGVTEMDTVRGDEMDVAETMSKQEMSLTLRHHSSEELRMVDEALDKLHGGIYGICENCEKNIEKPRLKARPFVRYCITCQEDIESKVDNNTGPVSYKPGSVV